MEARFNTSAHIANDSQAAAMGESTFGIGQDSHNLILIKIGQGIGAGIVLNGQPLYGDGFAAGEIGHVVVADSETGDLSATCSCGNRGCLETISSTRAILRRAAIEMESDQHSWRDLVAAFQSQDPAAVHVVRESGRYLGVAIANLIAAFNVHHIVISGRVSQFGELFLQAAQAEARCRALPTMVDETTLSYSVLGEDVVVLGSSALVLKHELGIV